MRLVHVPPDGEFEAAGAEIASDAAAALGGADIILKVRRPQASELAGVKPGALVIAIMDPYGQDASILTVETRVALTDDESRRRFRRYWLVIGPFSSLIRRMALRLLASELGRAAPVRPPNSAEPARPRRPRPIGLSR